ncbi:MAG TPA: LPXTG cell wall anchor domain-containing protein [Nocardioidaceae bacterium]|nr:LPXTG cell wall anchor domain-containing protein [Nocardioidaceae bacterium]
MNRGSKKGVLAALGAPVALTLTLGALPAYAGGDTSDDAEPKTTSTEKKDERYDDEKNDKSSKDDARAEAKADARAEAKADARAEAKGKASTDTKAESDGKAKTGSDARTKAESGEKADARTGAHARGDRDGRSNDSDGSSNKGMRGKSAATITLDGCYLSSTKDISYIDFHGEGAAAGKDENIGRTGFDLTAVAGIDSITSVEVKSGTTVKTFTIDCAADGMTPGDDKDSDKGDSDKGDSDKGRPGNGGHDKGTRGNSAATITLDGCYLSSTKDISYIDFHGEGAAAGKDENIGKTGFDLTSVAGIDTITSVEVKSGTTVKTFPIDCAADATAPGDDKGDSDKGDSDKGDSDKGDSDKGDSGKGDSDKGDSGKGDSDADAGAGGDTGTGNGGQHGTDTEAGVKTGDDVVAGAEGSTGAGVKADVTAQGGAVLGAEQQQTATAPTAPSTAYQQTGAQPTGMVLPQTGSEESTKLLTLGGLGMILAGAATMLGRRRFGLGRS